MIDVVIRDLADAFGLGVWVVERDDIYNKPVRVLRPIAFQWQDIEQGVHLPRPTFEAGSREGQVIFEKFIQRLHEMGYGKSKESVETGELKATKEHLADMKKLVFEYLAKPMVLDFDTGKIMPGRPAYSSPGDLKVDAGRVIRAARTCGQAAGVLKELFPELFAPGWESR